MNSFTAELDNKHRSIVEERAEQDGTSRVRNLAPVPVVNGLVIPEGSIGLIADANKPLVIWKVLLDRIVLWVRF